MSKKQYSKVFETRWSDFDANNHMRHTVYNDCAAQLRLQLMEDFGLSMRKLKKLQLGPILFKEETRYLREVHIGENIRIDLEFKGLSSDGRKWNILHHIYKASSDELAATVYVEGAWIDMLKRKTAPGPEGFTDTDLGDYKADDFVQL
jgi:acyl-CoA thioester hydrolase